MTNNPSSHQQTQSNIENLAGKPIRDGFGAGIVELATRDPRVVVLVADLTESLRLQVFKETFPDRFFQVGIAEENMAGISAGMAKEGLRPFACSFAAFQPGNSLGVIRSSICYSKLPVTLVSSHAGLSGKQDGATHQALEDIGVMRMLPNMSVVSPADANQAYQATLTAVSVPGPLYLRLSSVAPERELHLPDFEFGKGQVVQEGSRVAIIGTGDVLAGVPLASGTPATPFTPTIINLHTIKPLDTQLIQRVARTHQLIVTLENHQIAGGLGSAVLEALALSPNRPPVLRLGMQDSFGQSGTFGSLLEWYGLSQVKITTLLNDFRHNN